MNFAHRLHRRARGAARVWLCLLTAFAACAFTPPVQAKNVGLIVTVGQFKNKRLPALGGTAIDGEAMQAKLVKDWHFAPQDLHMLRDAQATRAAILAEIDGLMARSAPGDTVLIYYAGHGSSAKSGRNMFALPFDTGAWVPTDFAADFDFGNAPPEKIRQGLVIGHTDLLPRLKRLDDGGRFVLVLTDSCYSGQMVRSLGETVISRELPLPLAQAASEAPTTRDLPPPYPYKHVLMLSAASDSETAADISCRADNPGCNILVRHPTIDGQFHGAFTDALLRLMDGQLAGDKFYTYAQAQELLGAYLVKQGFAQTPQILPSVKEDGDNIASRGFLGLEQAAAPAALAATVRIRLVGVQGALRDRVAALPGVEVVDGPSDLLLTQTGSAATLSSPAGDPILQTAADDPLLPRRIAAEAWLNAQLSQGDQRFGLRADTDPGSRGGTFLQCETFAVEAALSRPAYLLVLDLNSEGQLGLLYPERDGELVQHQPGTALAVPGSQPSDRIVVTPPFGVDLVSVVALDQKPDLSGLMGDQLFGTDSERAAKLMQAIAGQKSGVLRMAVRTYPNPRISGPKCPAGTGG